MMPNLCLSQLCQQNKIIQQVNHEITVCVDEGSRYAILTSRFPIYFSFSSPSLYDCSAAHMSRTPLAFSSTQPIWLQFRKSFRHIRKTEA